MPLINRPTSINVFALLKIWYRAASINFKISDIEKIQSSVKSWLNQDTFEVLYRKKEDGGLNLTNLRYKMQATLLTNFLQTAINNNFLQNLYHKSLDVYYVHNIGIKPPLSPLITPWNFSKKSMKLRKKDLIPNL